MLKTVGVTVLAAVIAMVVYDKFIKKMVGGI